MSDQTDSIPPVEEKPQVVVPPPATTAPGQVHWIKIDGSGNVTASGDYTEGFVQLPENAITLSREAWLAGNIMSSQPKRYVAGAWQDSPPAAPPVPRVVSMAKAQIVMHNTPGSAADKSLLDDVNTAIASANNMELTIAWEKSAEVTRNGKFVQALIATLRLDATTVDNLFRAADAYQL